MATPTRHRYNARMPDRPSSLPGNGTTKALLALLVGLLSGGGGLSLYQTQAAQVPTEAQVEKRADEVIDRKGHYYDTKQIAQDIESIRRDMDDVLRQCTVRRRVR